MSSFMDVLEELCRVPGARGAIFVDYEGESIQQLSVDKGLSAYDLSVAGAHATPILTNLLKCDSVRLHGEDALTLIKVVTDLYAVILVADPNALSPRLQWAVDRAAVQLKALM